MWADWYVTYSKAVNINIENKITYILMDLPPKNTIIFEVLV